MNIRLHSCRLELYRIIFQNSEDHFAHAIYIAVMDPVWT